VTFNYVKGILVIYKCKVFFPYRILSISQN